MPEPMQIPPKPAGGLPSPLASATANAGPISSPQGNAGNVQAAMAKVSSGVKMLQEALPLIPMGNELHSKLLGAIKTLAEAMNKEGESPSTPKLDISSILQMIKQHTQNAPQNAAAKLLPAQGATQAPATGGVPPIPAVA